MNRLLLALTVLLSLSAVVVIVLRSSGAPPEVAGDPAANSPAVDPAPPVEQAEPVADPTPPAAATGASPTTTAPAAGSPPAAETEAERRARGFREQAARQQPYCARRLGWDRNDPRLRFVAEWLTAKWSEEMEAIDDIDSMADRDKPAAMRAWNEATEARRLALIQSVGVEAARQVSEQWCLYRFDADAMDWHRIDVTGQRVPFQNEDDAIWAGGELSTRSWENHR